MSAQYGAKKQPVNLPPGSVKGEVKGVRSGALMVADSNTNQAYFVQVAPDAKKVDITGEGDISLIKAGMFVRFDIKMDKQGNGKEELKKIELFTPDPQIARTGTEKKGDEDYLVAGRVKSFVAKTGKLQVEAVGDKPSDKIPSRPRSPRMPRWMLACAAGSGCALAKAGDSCTATGKVAKPSQPNNPGVLIADEIEVKLTKQLALELGKEKPEPKKVDKKAPEKKAAAKE